MKVYIGPYKHFWGPLQLAELLMKVGVSKDKCHEIGIFLAEKTPLSKLCEWVYSKRKRKVKIKIDDYDIWSMDTSLAYIILPMLKKLKNSKQGSPFVDDADVPEDIRSTNAPPKENDYDIDGYHHTRWWYVITEIIWAFEQIQSNTWEDQYYTGEHDWITEKNEDGLSELKKGPNHTAKFDDEGYAKHDARIQNGLMLFGKYFRSLWD
jgi:hypothetical protein